MKIIRIMNIALIICSLISAQQINLLANMLSPVLVSQNQLPTLEQEALNVVNIARFLPPVSGKLLVSKEQIQQKVKSIIEQNGFESLPRWVQGFYKYFGDIYQNSQSSEYAEIRKENINYEYKIERDFFRGPKQNQTQEDFIFDALTIILNQYIYIIFVVNEVDREDFINAVSSQKRLEHLEKIAERLDDYVNYPILKQEGIDWVLTQAEEIYQGVNSLISAEEINQVYDEWNDPIKLLDFLFTINTLQGIYVKQNPMASIWYFFPSPVVIFRQNIDRQLHSVVVNLEKFQIDVPPKECIRGLLEGLAEDEQKKFIELFQKVNFIDWVYGCDDTQCSFCGVAAPRHKTDLPWPWGEEALALKKSGPCSYSGCTLRYEDRVFGKTAKHIFIDKDLKTGRFPTPGFVPGSDTEQVARQLGERKEFVLSVSMHNNLYKELGEEEYIRAMKNVMELFSLKPGQIELRAFPWTVEEHKKLYRKITGIEYEQGQKALDIVQRVGRAVSQYKKHPDYFNDITGVFTHRGIVILGVNGSIYNMVFPEKTWVSPDNEEMIFSKTKIKFLFKRKGPLIPKLTHTQIQAKIAELNQYIKTLRIQSQGLLENTYTQYLLNKCA